jgi:hypothetical protein
LNLTATLSKSVKSKLLSQDHVCEGRIGRASRGQVQLTCDWDNCAKYFTKRDHITSHMKAHVPVNDLKCNVCDSTFQRTQDRQKHEKTKHPDWFEERHGVCERCDHIYSSVKDKAFQGEKVHGDKAKPRNSPRKKADVVAKALGRVKGSRVQKKTPARGRKQSDSVVKESVSQISFILEPRAISNILYLDLYDSRLCPDCTP